jgi:hypothetical protein
MSDGYDDLADRLQQVSDDLDTLMFDELRAASADGRQRPDADRRAVRARRSIEKAIGLLRSTDDDKLDD